MAVKVNILLSTYNGMRFLDQQIDSLLAQSHPDLIITARDDGSADGVYEVLLEYGSAIPPTSRSWAPGRKRTGTRRLKDPL